jgi:TolB-like protein
MPGIKLHSEKGALSVQQPHYALRKTFHPTIGLLVTLLALCSCVATRSDRYTESGSLEEIINRYFSGIGSIAEEHPLRLGILPYVFTGNRSSSENEFGTYLSEKITSRMAAASQRIRLFERNRFDALLKEHQLELSGMISGEDARTLGKLIPIDYLLTGTCTKLGTHLAISGRLIDVTSGEIVFSMNSECPISDEFAALLPEPPKPETNPEKKDTGKSSNPQQRCTALQERLESTVAKLPAGQQFAALIREGMKIPYDTVCSMIHYHIMERCGREQVNPPEYTAFLVKVFDEITDARDDTRGNTIFHYFRADGIIDDTEWQSALHFLKKVRWVDDYLRLLFPGDTLTPQIENRMRQLVPLCKKGTIGSVGVPFDVALHSALDALRLNYIGYLPRGATPPEQKRREREFLKVLAMFNDQQFDSIPHRYCSELISQWNHEKYSPLGDSLFHAICDLIQRSPPDKRIKPIVTLSSGLVWDVFKKDSTVEYHAATRRAMEYFARVCNDAITEATVQMDQVERSNASITAFCLATGITSPAIITIDSISIMLSSEDRSTRQRGFEYLYYLGEHASPLKNKLTRLLRQRADEPAGSGRSNEYLIRSIGAIAPGDPEVIRLLVSLLDKASPCFHLSDVTDALSSIGEPAVPAVTTYFEKDMDSHVFYTARFFEGMGKAALPHCAYLQKKAASCSNLKTRYRLEDAIGLLCTRK